MSKYIFCLLLLMYACSQRQETKVIAFDKMKVVLYDIMLADNYFRQMVMKDSLAAKKRLNMAYYKKVFQLHKVSQTDFYNTLQYYEQRPDKMKILFDSLEVYASKMKAKQYGAK